MTTTTVAETKRALIAEIQALTINTDLAVRAPQVQVSYGLPGQPELRQPEMVYFSEEMRTVSVDQRLVAGRRRRFFEWELDLVIESVANADTAAAEQRCFELAAAIEDFLADEPHCAAWPNAPVTDGALYVVVEGMRCEHEAGPDGLLLVRLSMELRLLERLV
jgi:hypothetical protein